MAKSPEHDRIAFALAPCLKPDCECAFRRKGRSLTYFAAEQFILRSPVCGGKIAKYGHVSRISGEVKARLLSEFQTAWRGERDSNPRYPFRYSGFQDRLFQPLTHPSAPADFRAVSN
jgi:hypothetical protein